MKFVLNKRKAQASTEYLLLVGLGIALVIGGVVLANVLFGNATTISNQLKSQEDQSLASLRSPCPTNVYSTNGDPGFEKGILGWTSTSAALTQSSSEKAVGQYSLYIPAGATASISNLPASTIKSFSFYYKTQDKYTQITVKGSCLPGDRSSTLTGANQLTNDGAWHKAYYTIASSCTSLSVTATVGDVWFDEYCGSTT